MKKFLLLALTFVGISFAQATQHSVTVTWTDNSNPSGTVYNVYRATGVCSTSSFTGATPLAPGVVPKTYQDTSVSVGQYCYMVRASQNSLESVDSNDVNPTIVPFAVVIQVTVSQ